MLADTGKPLRREHWTIHFALRLVFHQPVADPVPYLRRAWQVVRYQHPALGATISPNDAEDPKAHPHFSVGPLDAEAWANDTFTICHDHESAVDLFSSLYSTAAATCYWIPTSSEAVIRSSHWRIDGVGMALLSHDFMTALASVMQHGVDAPLKVLVGGRESVSSLAPNLELLVRGESPSVGSADGEEDPTLAAGADALVAEFLRGVPSIGLPTRHGSAELSPGASGCVVARLDTATTAKVAAACRERSIKVTSAVHAAIIRVTAGFPQHPLSKCYAAFVPVDLRRSLEAVATPESKAVSKVVGLYFSGLPVCVDSVLPEEGKNIKGFEDIARDLAAVYARDLLQFWDVGDGSGRKISFLDLAEPYVRRTTALFGAPVPEGLPPVQTPDLSSLGKVDTYLQREYGSAGRGKVEVADFWIGTEMLNRCVQFHTWSWRDELNLGACFNLSYYEKEFVGDILGKVIQELLQGCGVDT
ncbi:hypothetical protein DL771_009246 [Monosporascus sp. 5C6A]|nr:hypothetical protein DL771_009246 [Monosporascus sp. 5C6A]